VDRTLMWSLCSVSNDVARSSSLHIGNASITCCLATAGISKINIAAKSAPDHDLPVDAFAFRTTLAINRKERRQGKIRRCP